MNEYNNKKKKKYTDHVIIIISVCVIFFSVAALVWIISSRYEVVSCLIPDNPVVGFEDDVSGELSETDLNDVFVLSPMKEKVYPYDLDDDPYINDLSMLNKLDEVDRLFYASVFGSMSQNENADLLLTEEQVDRLSWNSEPNYFSVAAYITNLVYRQILADHPEIFWVQSFSFDIKKDISGFMRLEIDFHSIYSDDEIRQLLGELEDRADSSSEYISSSESGDDYELSKAAFEWVVENCKYSTKCYESMRTSDYDDKWVIEANSAYGVFIYGESICNGYAKSYQMLMERLGIPCTFVTGTIESTGESHAWNIIETDGSYHHVDTTWGDSKKGENEYVDYSFFYMTDSQISASRTVANEEYYPDCK